MTVTLVRGRAVLRGVAADGAVDVVDNGAVLVREGVIAAVDNFKTLSAAYPEAAVIGTERDVVVPGFVNAHHHVGVTPFQLGAPDLPLELWFGAKVGLRRVDPYLDTLHSAFELVASGVTTVQHLHVSRALPEEAATEADAILQAYNDIGLRASYSFGYRDQNRLVYETDEAFLARLPEPLAAELRPWFESQRMPVDDYLAWYAALRARFDGAAGGRLAVQLAPANLHWCSDRALEAIGAASARDSVPMHIHLLETQRQRDYAARRFGRSAVAHLDHLGLLGPLTTLGHMVWADADDLDRVVAAGSCICHNCSSNLRLGSGLADCREFIARGIPTAIGIDEAGLNDDRDMLQEMRLVLAVHRTDALDRPNGLSAGAVLRMATEYGAATTPFRGRIGRLDPGLCADLALYDWPTVAGVHLDAAVPLVDALVQRARAAAVRAVMVDGRLIYEDGCFILVDRNAAERELGTILTRAPGEAERRQRALGKALLPFVRQVYAGGTEPNLGA